MRPFLIIAGLSLVFIAALVLVAKPPLALTFLLPPVGVSHNIPYFLYLRAVQWLFGFTVGAVMFANGMLVLATAAWVFRIAWGYAGPRQRLAGAATAMILFELNPLAIVLPLTLGFLGGMLVAPLLLVVFIGVMLMVENWSMFMRALVLSVVWSFFPWVHLPTALFILIALMPWVLYTRRPLTALGLFLTVFLLGTFLFAVFWTVGCALARQWSLLQGPVDTLRGLGAYVQQELSAPLAGGGSAITERITRIIGWLSPFQFILGVWVTGQCVVRMMRERRVGTPDLAALLSIVILTVTVFASGKDVLPGAWYLLMVTALWTPLIARELAKKENFYSRGFRLTFSAGFVACGGVFWMLQGASKGILVPDAPMLAKLVGAVILTGGISYAALKKHPLLIEQRAQALLTGASLAYFLVMDYGLLG